MNDYYYLSQVHLYKSHGNNFFVKNYKKIIIRLTVA